ncbi:MAG: glycosyltransferase [Flavobacterium sp. BFFFF2]|nr:MAG: glycosyltransferase [Flavobacterium sp. BFFFF2]
MKILVIQKKRIGDVLTTTVLFEALKRKFPDAELHYLVYPNSLPVVQQHPQIDQLVVFDPKTPHPMRYFIGKIWEIRKARYQVIIDAYGKPNSLFLAWMSGAKRIISFEKKKYKWLTTDSIVRKKSDFSIGTSAIDHRMQLLEPLGIPFEVLRPKIYLTEHERIEAQHLLAQHGLKPTDSIWMISAIGSRDFKTYPLAYMADLLAALIEVNPHASLLFNYEPQQQAEAQALFEACSADVQSHIVKDLYVSDLRSFLAVLSYCRALMGNEGGATNMAKALNIPTFSVYSPEVNKIGWDMFKDGHTHCSVHLHDFESAAETEGSHFLVKYDRFVPTLFIDQWQAFVQRHSS